MPATVIRKFAALSLLTLVGGCATPHRTVSADTGLLIRADGTRIGKVRMVDDQIGSRIHIEASGLPPGIHGVHLHAVGRCDPPDFATAGGHWNPMQRQHGHDNPAGHHAGDLGNVSVEPDGHINTDLIATDVRLRDAARGKAIAISDQDGASLILHAKPDDERTDPSGNSGSRIACAILAAPRH